MPRAGKFCSWVSENRSSVASKLMKALVFDVILGGQATVHVSNIILTLPFKDWLVCSKLSALSN